MHEYLCLAVPCVAITAVEWWAWEFLGIFAGYMHSPDKLAAHVTAINIGSMLYLAGTGAQKAASTLVGQACGRGDESELRSVSRAAVQWNICCGTCFGLLVVIFRWQLVKAYNPGNPAIQSKLVDLTPLIATQGFIDGMNQCIQGMLFGLGMQAEASKISLFCYWLVMLPLAALLAFPVNLGLEGLWLGCVLAGLTSVALNIRLLTRIDFASIAQAAALRMSLDSTRGDCSVGPTMATSCSLEDFALPAEATLNPSELRPAVAPDARAQAPS